MDVDYDALQRVADADQRRCVVGALILDTHGRVFVHRRGWDRAFLPGAWDIVGGHVDHGETLLDALAREVEEETGWRMVGSPRLVYVGDWFIDPADPASARREFDFLIQVDGDLDQPRLEWPKHVEYRWIGKDGLSLLDENRGRDDGVVRHLVEIALRSGSSTVSSHDALRITAYLDAEAPPTVASAHIVFGTNQTKPAELVARRYHDGLAPLIILTGGVNRRTGVVEALEHRRILLELGVPEAVIGYEDTSVTTQGNVEAALPLLREALRSNLELTAVCKWYHRRAIQVLRAHLPDVALFHAVTWEPVYEGIGVTRSDWWLGAPASAERVLKEWHVIPERLAAGSLKEVQLVDGAWR